MSKIIHYCWFGGSEKPPIVKKCIDSWKEYFPDFEIMEWNEQNFDIHNNLTFLSSNDYFFLLPKALTLD